MGRPRTFTEEQGERLRQQHAAGVPISFLAIEYGATRWAVRNVIYGYPDPEDQRRRHLLRRISASESIDGLWIEKGRRRCRDSFHAPDCRHLKVLQALD